jgi:hypothetical protein
MKVTRYESSQERRILLAVIASDGVCGRIAGLSKEDALFAHRASEVIARLCFDHHERYGRAPGADIEHLVRSWSEGKPEDAVGEVDDLIQSIDLEKLDNNLNVDLIIDEAGDYFDRVRMERTADLIKAHVTAGQVKKARELFDNYKPVQMGAGSYINPLTDDAALDRMYSQKREPLIEYPGGLGDFLGHTLEREGLVAILAAEKMGKSYFLMDLAFAAVEQGKKVAFFECGDLTESQVLYRMYTRICGRPLNLPKGRPVLEYRIPVAVEWKDGQLKVKHETYEIRKPLPAETIRKWRNEWNEKHDATNNWRLSVHSASSLSVPMMRSILSRWEKDRFNPDVVVVDYADLLLGPLAGGGESREQVNATWKGLSKMRQDLRCLVLTATQANADAYEADALNRRNFSEDKRKHAHVSGMFALNQSDAEYKQGVYRINWLDRRDEPYSQREFCYVAGCLAVARPMMMSYYSPKWRQK